MGIILTRNKSRNSHEWRGSCQTQFHKAMRKGAKITAKTMPDGQLLQVFRFVDTSGDGQITADECAPVVGAKLHRTRKPCAVAPHPPIIHALSRNIRLVYEVSGNLPL